MSEKTLIYDDGSYRVTIRDYQDGKVGKTLHNEILIMCKDFDVFCDIVNAVKGVLNEWETICYWWGGDFRQSSYQIIYQTLKER